MSKKTKIVILAAGRGTRMSGDLPKVLAQVKGTSMIRRLLESVEKSGIDENPVIIVGYKKELVMQELADKKEKYHFITQENQLGTGHAVGLAKDYLKGKAENIIVLYGDHPFVSAETIQKINNKHIESGKKITMATVKLPDFKDWRINFVNFSRIIRDADGKMVKDVQFKDATNEEIKVTEVIPCYFCCDAAWLWEKLDTLKDDNAQKEYYLTDLVKIATENNIETESIDIEAHEALGANTNAELLTLERFAV